MTAHSVLNVRAAPEWGNSELYKYYERNGLGYGTVHRWPLIGDDDDECADVGFGSVKPAQLSGHANGLLGTGCIPASLAGVVLVPAHDPGQANGDGVSAVGC